MMRNKNKTKTFINKYIDDFKSLILADDQTVNKLIEVFKLMIKLKRNNKKIIIAGNGGSAAISSHFSVDLTKNAKIRSVNFNEADLITCFSNDFGFENWLINAIKFYCNKGDILFLVSVSGKSKNMLNAAKYAKKYGIKKLSHLQVQKKITL